MAMNKVIILGALILFSYLRGHVDTVGHAHPGSKSNSTAGYTLDVLQEFTGCDLSCMSADASVSLADQTSSILDFLREVCTQVGCAIKQDALDTRPLIPVQEYVPAIINEMAPRFEAPGLLNVLIIES